MRELILAHDLGTSGNKATLYDGSGHLVASCIAAYETLYAPGGIAEQNPDDWWRAVCVSTKELLEKVSVSPCEIAAVTFSGQMMGCLLVDAQGNPLGNSMIWADTRSSEQERFILDRVGMERMYRITGHRASSSYSAAKLLWIRDNDPSRFSRAYKMLNAKDFIIQKLTGKFVTDPSDASGTNLYDLNKCTWSSDIISDLQLDVNLFPDLQSSLTVVGSVSASAAHQCGLIAGISVVMGGGDGCCAAVGAGAIHRDRLYNVLGSSSWIAGASDSPLYDPEMRIFNWAHLIPGMYSPCGTMQAAGNSIAWMKKNLCADISRDRIYGELECLIASCKPGSGSVLFLPYLLGERSPRWNPDARGAFVGIDMTTDRSQLCRAVYEGVAFNLRLILERLSILGARAPAVKIIGGGAASAGWLQILADIWQTELEVPLYVEEATSMGAAVCAGVAVGLYSGFDVIDRFNPVIKTVKPNPKNKEIYDRLFPVFDGCYNALLPVYESLASLRES